MKSNMWNWCWKYVHFVCSFMLNKKKIFLSVFHRFFFHLKGSSKDLEKVTLRMKVQQPGSRKAVKFKRKRRWLKNEYVDLPLYFIRSKKIPVAQYSQDKHYK